MSPVRTAFAGGWLPRNRGRIDQWVQDLKARVAAHPTPLVPPIQDLGEMVNDDPVLRFLTEAMFKEAAQLKQQTPLGTPEVEDFDAFLVLLNGIMTQAPEYTECPDSTGEEAPCGLIDLPINALLDWPMATGFGYEGRSILRLPAYHPGLGRYVWMARLRCPTVPRYA